MNWEQLKKDGFHILKTKGDFDNNGKNESFTEYSLVKTLSDTERTIKCYLNKIAVKEAVKRFSFDIKECDTEVRWCFVPKSFCISKEPNPMIVYFTS